MAPSQLIVDSVAASAKSLLANASVVFWDFDGVVKDSVGIKSDAFERLFLPYGRAMAARVRAHHEQHTGVSRYEKMPLYLKWAGEPTDAAHVERFCARFSKLVYQAVVDSRWVAGVREYLRAHHAAQAFVLVTATPQQEIETILTAIEISHCFREVHGAPMSKNVAIKSVLQRWQLVPAESLMIGDSASDLAAADANGVPFLLRRTPHNQDLQQVYTGATFDELKYE